MASVTRSKRLKGTGIAGTIKRLRLLYGDAQCFETNTRPDAGFQVAFEIPLRLADAPGVKRDQQSRGEEAVGARAHRG